MPSIRRNILSSSIAYLSLNFIRAIQQLVWVPLYLWVFGKNIYGDWITLAGLASYLAIADFGIQTYWLNLLTKEFVNNDIPSYRRLFRSGLCFFSILTVVSLVLVVIFVFANGPAKLLKMKHITNEDSNWVFLSLVLSTLLLVFSQMLRGVFRSIGNNPKFVWFGVARETITLFGVALALYFKFGPVGVAFTYVVIGVFLIGWVVRTVYIHHVDLVDFNIFKADIQIISKLIRGGAIQLVGLFSQMALLQGPFIVSNWMLGAGSVALLSTSRTLTNLATQVSGSIYNSTLPEYSKLEAEKNDSQIWDLLRQTISWVLLISGLLCVFICNLGPWVFRRWTLGKFEDSILLISLLAFAVLVDSIKMPVQMLLLGCNNLKWSSYADLTYAVTSLGLMYYLMNSLGIIAVPVAMILCCGLFHVTITHYAVLRIIGRPRLLKLIRKYVACLSLLAVFIAVLIMTRIAQKSILIQIFTSCSLALIYFAVTWVFLFENRDKNRIYMMFKAKKQSTKGSGA